jgi:regulator of protease activity HflC (stomatin/prohibitin superfamily)
LLVIAFLVIPFSFHTVNTGELAVVRHLGKITDVREAGTNFDLWFVNKYEKYDTKVQNVDILTAAYSSDAQTMEVTMTLQYQIMPDKVIDIATQYGSLEILQSRIQSIAIEKTKAVLSSYKAMDISHSAHRFLPQLRTQSRTRLAKNIS